MSPTRGLPAVAESPAWYFTRTNSWAVCTRLDVLAVTLSTVMCDLLGGSPAAYPVGESKREKIVGHAAPIDSGKQDGEL
ncbi:hypothetical protein BN1708_004822 [Verticillium longisporum]|uniref:Uncharacterized protein n=1 Tax=Verticillium longisporum TaxID=100787 RepID=A0A0G4M405_VERLO|nr:hypothetical protein BN1708_004822 [Verticillium longisporum]